MRKEREEGRGKKGKKGIGGIREKVWEERHKKGGIGDIHGRMV